MLHDSAEGLFAHIEPLLRLLALGNIESQRKRAHNLALQPALSDDPDVMMARATATIGHSDFDMTLRAGFNDALEQPLILRVAAIGLMVRRCLAQQILQGFAQRRCKPRIGVDETALPV